MDDDRAQLTADLSRPPLPMGVLAAVPAAFLSLFFVYPVSRILVRALSADALSSIAGDDRLRSVLWFTAWQAALSTVLTVVAALPITWVLSRFRFAGHNIISALVFVPFVLPTLVVAAAFGALWPGATDGSLGAVIAAHVYFNLAVVVRTVGGFWERLDPGLTEVARTLGASPLRAFRTVTLPLLRPSLAAAASLVFTFCFTSFGVVLLLGGPRRATVETEIYRQTTQLLRVDRAAALALVQIAALFVLLLVAARWQARQELALGHHRASQRPRPRGYRQVMLIGSIVATTVAAVAAPLVALCERAFRDPGGRRGLANFRALAQLDSNSGLFARPLTALRVSLLTAATAAALALVVGGCASICLARSRHPKLRAILDSLVALPLATSAVTVGFGFLVAFARPPLDWRSRPIAVPLVQSIVAVPFVVRTLVPGLRAIDPRLREAAATLGATPAQVWRAIDGRLVLRPLATAAGFALAISLGEFGATTFLARPSTPTMTVVIARLLGRPGEANVGQAMAMTVVLAITVGSLALVTELSRGGRSTGFGK